MQGCMGFKGIWRDLGSDCIVGGYGRGGGFELEASVGIKSGN
jgi:hypothetical protein